MAKYEKKNIVDIEALKKNEFGQYIVDDLNKFQRSKVWRSTEHPCSATDPQACLDCPYTDCIAPAAISQQGTAYIAEHEYYPNGGIIDRPDGSWMPRLGIPPKGSVKRRYKSWYDSI